jgi:hypothetical protein
MFHIEGLTNLQKYHKKELWRCKRRAFNRFLRTSGQAFFQQVFGDLYGIGSRPFSQVVRHDPKVQAVGLTFIPPDPPDEYLVLPMGGNRHGVQVF